MPKTKASSVKSSKKPLLTGRFKPKRIQVLSLLLVLSALGVGFMRFAHAGYTDTTFVAAWYADVPTSVIQHPDRGDKTGLITRCLNIYYANPSPGYGFCTSNQAYNNTAFTQFGPYTKIGSYNCGTLCSDNSFTANFVINGIHAAPTDRVRVQVYTSSPAANGSLPAVMLASQDRTLNLGGNVLSLNFDLTKVGNSHCGSYAYQYFCANNVEFRVMVLSGIARVGYVALYH